jgi:hypothetical protein
MRGRRQSKRKAVDTGDPRNRQIPPPRPWLDPSSQIGLAAQILVGRPISPPCRRRAEGAPPPPHCRPTGGPRAPARTVAPPCASVGVPLTPEENQQSHLATHVAIFDAEGPLLPPGRATGAARGEGWKRRLGFGGVEGAARDAREGAPRAA